MLKKIVFASFCLLAPLVASASNLPDYPFIHVNGVGSSYALPDTGQIDFEITAVDADPALAVGVVTARAEEVRALMQELGLSLQDLETRDVRKDIKKPEANTPAGTVLYEVRCGVRINVRDLSKWQALAGALISKPNLDGFMTMFDNSDRMKIEMELISDAVKIARRKAQLIATGLGRQLGPVSAVTNGELKNLTRAMGLAPAELNYREPRRPGLDQVNVLAVNILKFSQQVDIIYRLK